jgi:hypothetical protein
LHPRITSPNATAAAAFNENVMIEINIDNTGDFVEDLVIQAVKRGDKMYFFGPYAPSSTGTSSMINTSKAAGSVASFQPPENGMNFSPDLETILSFDLGQFQEILGGNASDLTTPGTDTLLGLMYFQ